MRPSRLPHPLIILIQALLWILVVGFLPGCDRDAGKEIDLSERIDEETLRATPASNAPPPLTLYFGFDLRSTPQEDARQYLPFLDYLARTTGYRFQLHFTPPNQNIVEELGRGKIQFAAMGAGSYLQARQRFGAKILARGLNRQGQADYRSALVVRADSPIKEVTDLRGKRMAFGAETSTQGHIIPRIMLTEAGLTLHDLADYSYTGSHAACADAVISGKYDVCGMQDILASKLAAEGRLSILQWSAYFPSSGIVANATVPPEMVEQLKRALIEFQPNGRDRDHLYRWDDTEMAGGFIEARDSDYDTLRAWSIRFGLLAETRDLPTP